MNKSKISEKNHFYGQGLTAYTPVHTTSSIREARVLGQVVNRIKMVIKTIMVSVQKNEIE